MDFKDQYPIGMFNNQTEWEKVMYNLNKAIIELPSSELTTQLIRIYWDFQHKINIYKERGVWK